MSKHNYSQHYNKPKNPNTVQHNAAEAKRIEPIPTPTPAPVELVEETISTVSLPTTVEGVVSGCAKLNVRAEASLFADIVCVLDASSEIEIDVNKSNNEWFYICTATGVEGYCMRKFVEAHL